MVKPQEFTVCAFSLSTIDIITCPYNKRQNYVCHDKWLKKKSKGKVTFIDESLYLDLSIVTLRIDSSSIVYVTNSL